MTFAISILTMVIGLVVLWLGLFGELELAARIMFQAIGIVLFWVTLVGLTAASEIRRLKTQVKRLSERSSGSAASEAEERSEGDPPTRQG
jgi:hypothetical protein